MRALLPWFIVALGAAALVAGVSWISIPAGLIVAGVLLVTAGLFAIDDGEG
jgi:ABC-type transport system involved in cytochrome bd biosynthesis fused ATPase/permease subunit